MNPHADYMRDYRARSMPGAQRARLAAGARRRALMRLGELFPEELRRLCDEERRKVGLQEARS